MAAVRGMGVAVMTSRSGSLPGAVVAAALGPEGGPLLHAEAVLLVDDHHPEGAEGHLVGEQGVGADEEVDRAVGQAGVDARSAPPAVRPVGEEGDPQRAVALQGGRVGNGQSVEQASAPRRRAARPAPRSAPSARPGARPRRPPAGRPPPPPSCPSPTSPWSSRCMGRGPARSSRMAVDGPRAGPAVSSKGRPVEEPVDQGGRARRPAVDDVADAPGVALEPRLAQHQGQLQPEQLVEGQPAPGRLASRPRWPAGGCG